MDRTENKNNDVSGTVSIFNEGPLGPYSDSDSYGYSTDAPGFGDWAHEYTGHEWGVDFNRYWNAYFTLPTGSNGEIGWLDLTFFDQWLPGGVSQDADGPGFGHGTFGATPIGSPPDVHSAPAGNADAPAKPDMIVPVCFPAGTQVLMKNGSSKRIEQLEKDEWVVAASDQNPEGPVQACRVVETYRNDPQLLLAVRIAGESIRCTFKHPFYVKCKGWTGAEDLKVGDKLRTPQNEWVKVESVSKTGVAEPVFNIHIESNHTYFVQLPDTYISVLVHNRSGVAPSPVQQSSPVSPSTFGEGVNWRTVGGLSRPHSWCHQDL